VPANDDRGVLAAGSELSEFHWGHSGVGVTPDAAPVRVGPGVGPEPPMSLKVEKSSCPEIVVNRAPTLNSHPCFGCTTWFSLVPDGGKTGRRGSRPPTALEDDSELDE